MLYDGMLQAVGKAKTAIEEGRIEDRFNATQKACRILLALQANLDFDQGGDMAVMLDRFYHTLFRDLQAINLRNSVTLCDDVIAALKEVRRSWGDLADQDDRGDLVIDRAGSPVPPKDEARAHQDDRAGGSGAVSGTSASGRRRSPPRTLAGDPGGVRGGAVSSVQHMADVVLFVR
jgi:flagellar protein FliS